MTEWHRYLLDHLTAWQDYRQWLSKQRDDAQRLANDASSWEEFKERRGRLRQLEDEARLADAAEQEAKEPDGRRRDAALRVAR